MPAVRLPEKSATPGLQKELLPPEWAGGHRLQPPGPSGLSAFSLFARSLPAVQRLQSTPARPQRPPSALPRRLNVSNFDSTGRGHESRLSLSVPSTSAHLNLLRAAQRPGPIVQNSYDLSQSVGQYGPPHTVIPRGLPPGRWNVDFVNAGPTVISNNPQSAVWPWQAGNNNVNFSSLSAPFATSATPFVPVPEPFKGFSAQGRPTGHLPSLDTNQGWSVPDSIGAMSLGARPVIAPPTHAASAGWLPLYDPLSEMAGFNPPPTSMAAPRPAQTQRHLGISSAAVQAQPQLQTEYQSHGHSRGVNLCHTEASTEVRSQEMNPAHGRETSEAVSELIRQGPDLNHRKAPLQARSPPTQVHSLYPRRNGQMPNETQSQGPSQARSQAPIQSPSPAMGEAHNRPLNLRQGQPPNQGVVKAPDQDPTQVPDRALTPATNQVHISAPSQPRAQVPNQARGQVPNQTHTQASNLVQSQATSLASREAPDRALNRAPSHGQTSVSNQAKGTAPDRIRGKGQSQRQSPSHSQGQGHTARAAASPVRLKGALDLAAIQAQVHAQPPDESKVRPKVTSRGMVPMAPESPGASVRMRKKGASLAANPASSTDLGCKDMDTLSVNACPRSPRRPNRAKRSSPHSAGLVPGQGSAENWPTAHLSPKSSGRPATEKKIERSSRRHASSQLMGSQADVKTVQPDPVVVSAGESSGKSPRRARPLTKPVTQRTSRSSRLLSRCKAENRGVWLDATLARALVQSVTALNKRLEKADMLAVESRKDTVSMVSSEDTGYEARRGLRRRRRSFASQRLGSVQSESRLERYLSLLRWLDQDAGADSDHREGLQGDEKRVTSAVEPDSAVEVAKSLLLVQLAAFIKQLDQGPRPGNRDDENFSCASTPNLQFLPSLPTTGRTGRSNGGRMDENDSEAKSIREHPPGPEWGDGTPSFGRVENSVQHAQGMLALAAQGARMTNSVKDGRRGRQETVETVKSVSCVDNNGNWSASSTALPSVEQIGSNPALLSEVFNGKPAWMSFEEICQANEQNLLLTRNDHLESVLSGIGRPGPGGQQLDNFMNTSHNGRAQRPESKEPTGGARRSEIEPQASPNICHVMTHSLLIETPDEGRGMPQGGAREVDVIRIHEDPEVVVMPNFLTDEECAALIMEAGTKWEKSKTSKGSVSASQDTYVAGEGSIRTSSSVRLGKGSSALTDRIERRVAAAAGTDPACVESLVLVRYRPGEYFKEHHDGGFRPTTVLIYLNDVSDGGETEFVELGFKAIPRKGTAMMWRNVLPDGSPDFRLKHAALPSPTEVKYAVNCFINKYPQVVYREMFDEGQSDDRLNLVQGSTRNPTNTTEVSGVRGRPTRTLSQNRQRSAPVPMLSAPSVRIPPPSRSRSEVNFAKLEQLMQLHRFLRERAGRRVTNSPSNFEVLEAVREED